MRWAIDAVLVLAGGLSLLFGAFLLLMTAFDSILAVFEFIYGSTFPDGLQAPWLSASLWFASAVMYLFNGCVMLLKQLSQRRFVIAMTVINIAALVVFNLTTQVFRFGFDPEMLVVEFLFFSNYLVALIAVARRSPQALRLLRRAGPWES